MATVFEYMQLATRVYAASERNVIDVPAGWRQVDWQPDRYTGFSAGVYMNDATNELIISYTGTNSMVADPLSWTAGLGLPAPQIYDAMAYYFAFRQAYPTANIAFTGHSLGGGLASLMAVMFDKQATVFDEAPFQLAAMNPALMPSYAAAMATAGYVDDALVTFIASAGLLALTRESSVTHYYLEGEVLAPIRVSANTLVGNDNPIALGDSTAGLIDRHSMALMTALWYSPAFLAVARKIPDLITQLLDTNLFATDSRNPDKNDLLRRLLRHQLGVTGDVPANGMLDRFVADMNKVAQDGGFALTNAHITNTLVAFAMQMYYENPEAAVAGKTLFASVTGGIRFDRTDVAATLADAKGWQMYFQNYLNTLTLEEHRIVLQLLPAATDWFIQAGSLSMSATADISKAFMVGGTGNDWMVGGSQADLLIGNAGDDTLNGDAGNDTLMGGAGDDTYILDPGDGYDTILDTDGSGSIILDGITLSGGALVAGAANVWKDSVNGLTYTLQGSGADQVLLVGKDGSNIGIRIQGWQAGQLDLNMSGTIAPPANTTITGADGYSDGLIGSGGIERILGLSGNDALDGGGGDDVIEGGTGDDLLAGGAGSDLIYGGAGRDMILSAAGLALQLQKDRNNDGVLDDWAPPAGAGAVWTSGRLWGIYATNDGSETVDGGGPENQDSAGDIVFAGGDDDKVIGGLGDDYIDGGAERHDSAPNISICLLHQLNTPNNQNLTRAYN